MTLAQNTLTPESYTNRFYRNLVSPDQGVSFQVQEGESDLWIHTDKPREILVREALREVRQILIDHIEKNPVFETSLDPLPSCPSCHEIIREMLDAAEDAGVGPMAGVAGAVAKWVGETLLEDGAPHVLVENGGDLFLYRPRFSTTIGLFAGQSPLSLKVGIKIPPTPTPMGIATSSGTVGPSLSFGKADAVCAISTNAVLADAAVTAIANRIQTPEDLEAALTWGASLEGITGIAAIIQSRFAAWGAVEVVKL
ncbi:MAG: UPF0280 family protein [Deltaproteobacteria bacterium]|nr:UPF0280 family protein [Deltaproteobacteria bacterium]